MSPDEPQSPVAGWYDNPEGPGTRYWDGAKWTEQYSRSPLSSEARTYWAQSERQPVALWVGVVAVVAIIVGALGPWVLALGASLTGTSGGRDGPWLISAALVAALLLLGFARTGNRWFTVGAGTIAIVLGFVCVGDMHTITALTTDDLGEHVSAGIGWGLWLALVGCVALALSSFVARRGT